eukprot:UN33981
MGTSISVLVPVMPFLATSLGLSVFQYGAINSVIGLSRIVSNIPLTCFVESYGRRSLLVFGPLVTSSTMLGI